MYYVCSNIYGTYICGNTYYYGNIHITMYVSGGSRGQKRASDPPELEFQMVFRHVGAG